jgi:hypothetical protein
MKNVILYSSVNFEYIYSKDKLVNDIQGQNLSADVKKFYSSTRKYQIMLIEYNIDIEQL